VRPAAAARGGGAHRGRAVVIVVHRGRLAGRLPVRLLRGLLLVAARARRGRRGLPPLALLLAVQILERLGDDHHLGALAAAVAVVPLVVLQVPLDVDLRALPQRLQDALGLLVLAAVPDLHLEVAGGVL